MTVPGDIVFNDESVDTGTSVTEGYVDTEERLSDDSKENKFPPPILEGVSKEKLDALSIWLEQWIDDLTSDQSDKQRQWSDQEEAYRAMSDYSTTGKPFVGASSETIPAIAMAVDPIHARLDTGIFKQDPVFQVKPLKKSFSKYNFALTQWINYYQKNVVKLRRIASPRILELTKLGTCVFKTVYDRQCAKIKTYDPVTWNVVEKEEVRFNGPRTFGISIGDFLFPSLYQDVQDCPIVVERQRTTIDKLKVAEASGKLANVDKIKGQETNYRTQLEDAHEESSSHKSSRRYHEDIEVFEAWFDYDIDGNGLPEHLVATYHKDTRTFLQLRYNWYFHQRKPYTVIPYQLTNDSLYGIGIGEMVKPFQDALTKWHRMASDNAYLANIRMFIVKRESGIEEVPRLYAGRCFFVDDPRSDFIPFSGGDVYPSTLAERQNLFGLAEKRTGVSDYLTGRESPIIGSRATATSTLALIQEGTKRVEEVLENIRNGLAEVVENWIYIWIQYGLGDLDDIVFDDDDTGRLVNEFFKTITAENVNGALAIDLTATDAAGNRQAMQAMQLQIIQVMMQYLEKVLAAGQAMLMAKQANPELATLIIDVTGAARQMFRDLLQKYDITNPDDYLPDLEKYLNGGPAPQQAGIIGPAGAITGAPQLGGVQDIPSAMSRPAIPVPSAPGSGAFNNNIAPVAG